MSGAEPGAPVDLRLGRSTGAGYSYSSRATRMYRHGPYAASVNRPQPRLTDGEVNRVKTFSCDRVR